MTIHSNYESEFMSMVLSAVESLVYQKTSKFMLNNNGSESSDFNGIFFQNETLFATHNQLNTNYPNYTNVTNHTELETERQDNEKDNYWALLAIFLVIGTACGNILVCLAIAWEKRLQNVTNYFLASLAITDLMVAVLVMPLGIWVLYNRGYFPLKSYHCLIWVCLDVLFCTSSIMHLCTISIDRYLSLRYPMRFGRNKTRKRVVLKIFFVWLLSIAMSLPLSLMYSKDHASVLVDGTCQIPDPTYKLIGSIVCFYIPLLVMLLTYTLTVRLLARQRQSLGGSGSKVTTGGWSGWMGAAPLERKTTWRRFIKSSVPSTPNHAHSAGSTDTELSTLDINTQELWLPESSIPEPTPSTMAALHTFGAEMLKLSRGLESFTPMTGVDTSHSQIASQNESCEVETDFDSSSESKHHKILLKTERNVNNKTKNNDRNKKIAATLTNIKKVKRRASLNVFNATKPSTSASSMRMRHRSKSIQAFEREQRALDDDFFYELKRHKKKQHKKNDGDSTSLELPPPVCTCPYFGDKPCAMMKPIEVKIITTSSSNFLAPERTGSHIHHPKQQQQQNESNQFISNSSNSISNTPSTMSLPTVQSSLNRVHRKQSSTKCNAIVTWDSRHSYHRRGSNLNGSTRTTLLTPTQPKSNTINATPLRRSATLRNNNNSCIAMSNDENSTSVTRKIPSSPCILQRATTIRSHHSRNSSVISRNSARHGRIIRLEQKATKVLGVVFFTFVILWAPFFVLNLLPTVCPDCESNIGQGVFDFVTWLGYASSCVNPIFYSCFNNVFRQAFKKVLMCQYKRSNTIWRPPSLNHTHR